MKPIVFSLLFFSIGISAFAQNKINWMTWEEAVEANKTEPKLIFVDTYTTWCGWCKKMDQTTFKQPFIVEYMNARYYSVKMNAEMKDSIDFNGYTFVNPSPSGKRSTHQLAASLLDNKLSYPSFVFLNQNFERLQIVPGFQNAKNFEVIVRYFLEGASAGLTQEQFMKDFKPFVK